MKVWLFIPCLVDQFYPEVGEGMARILARLGFDLEYPAAQTCCGQPAFNSGFFEEAARVAEHFLDVFRNAPLVVGPSGSCISMVRIFYKRLKFNKYSQEDVAEIAGRFYEFSEFLVKKMGIVDVGARFDGRVTYHAACHLLRELGVREEPLELLKHVRGLQFVPMRDAEACCGFGGTFAVKYPLLSTSMGEYKVRQALAVDAEYVVMNDVSCMMHMQGIIDRQKLPLRALHIVHVLSGLLPRAAREVRA